MNFKQKLENITQKNNTLLCIGLDSETADPQFDFNKSIIDATFDLVCCYKLNSAFYEAEGSEGLAALKKTIQYIQATYPDIPIILDAKRGDVENTNKAYAKAIFDDLGVDGVTVNPYLGGAALQPFFERSDKGIFVLIKTSNPGAGEFQDLEVDGKPLYQVVTEHVLEWNKNGNLAVVVGATYPEELKKVREIVGDIPILIPGIGAQNGDLEAILKNGLNKNKQGLIISSSRGIIFAPNPREAVLSLDHKIKEALK